jgi:hypothetical protein
MVCISPKFVIFVAHGRSHVRDNAAGSEIAVQLPYPARRRYSLSTVTSERSSPSTARVLMMRQGPGGSGQRGRGALSTVRITGACPPSRIRSTPGVPRLSGAGSAPATGSHGCKLTSTPPIVIRAELIVTSRETNPDCKKSLAAGSAKSRPSPRDQTKQDTSPCPVICKAGASGPGNGETSTCDETAMRCTRTSPRTIA